MRERTPEVFALAVESQRGRAILRDAGVADPFGLELEELPPGLGSDDEEDLDVDEVIQEMAMRTDDAGFQINISDCSSGFWFRGPAVYNFKFETPR